MLEKPERREDSAYLDHVRTYCCCACGKQEAEAHHLLGGGMGTKGSDYSAVPLCRVCHAEAHQVGSNTFQKKRDVNLWGVAWRLVVEYFTGTLVK